jgi:uncharacterized protein YggE
VTVARVLAATSLLASALTGQASGADSADVRTGFTARRSIRATQASFTVQFTADGVSPAKAQSQLAMRADSVRRALQTLGIPRDSILTSSSWSWWPERIQISTKPRLVQGAGRFMQAVMDTVRYPGGGWSIGPKLDSIYRAREILSVRVGDPRRAGPAIDALVALGLTEISRVQFRSADEDVDKVRVELVREATTRATEQAAAIAQASGMRLGRVIYVGTLAPESGAYRGGLYDLTTTSSSSEGSPGTEITAPSVTVTMTVYGHWKLVPPQ